MFFKELRESGCLDGRANKVKNAGEYDDDEEEEEEEDDDDEEEEDDDKDMMEMP